MKLEHAGATHDFPGAEGAWGGPGRSGRRIDARSLSTNATAAPAEARPRGAAWLGMTGEGLLLDPATLLPPEGGPGPAAPEVPAAPTLTKHEPIATAEDGAAVDTVSLQGNTLMISTTDADDEVDVGSDAASGDVVVWVNGVEHRFAAADVTRLWIQVHGGDDIVMVAADLQIDAIIDGGAGNDVLVGGAGADQIDGGEGHDTLLGGAGNDRLIGGNGNDLIHGGAGDDTIDGGAGDDRIFGDDGDDRIQAGEGNDWADGGAGDDYLDGSFGDDQLFGGEGRDTLYGGEGRDYLNGGAGDDYLDGYLGNDILLGGDGNDILSGGPGEDLLFGDAGDDRIYTGSGRSVVVDWFGSNAVHYQANDQLMVNEATWANWQTGLIEPMAVPDTIRIDGTAAFQSRIRADLETLAASPTGQQMIADITRVGLPVDQGGQGYTMSISETSMEGGASLGIPGYVGPSRLQINPAYHLNDVNGRITPIVVLYHEMAHGRNVMNGNMALGVFADWTDPGNPDNPEGMRMVRNEERQAVGLPIDLDGDPATPAEMSPTMPEALTENALRAELGYPRRASYLPPEVV